MKRAKEGEEKGLPEELWNDQEREFEFSEEKVRIKRRIKEEAFIWDVFTSYGNIEHYIYLTKYDTNTLKRILLIDKKNMTDDEIEELYSLLQKKIEATGGL